MKYKNTVRGIFKDRPNRFIAHVRIGDKLETVHVKNTAGAGNFLFRMWKSSWKRMIIQPERRNMI